MHFVSFWDTGGINMPDLTFSTQLTKLRKAKKLNQEQASELLGISRSTYANYEVGAREPNLALLKKMAMVFGVSADYLLGLSDDPTRH